MEWIMNYWYAIVLGLVTAMFLFGYRKTDSTDVAAHEEHEAETEESSHKSGRSGCCC